MLPAAKKIVGALHSGSPTHPTCVTTAARQHNLPSPEAQADCNLSTSPFILVVAYHIRTTNKSSSISHFQPLTTHPLKQHGGCVTLNPKTISTLTNKTTDFEGIASRPPPMEAHKFLKRHTAVYVLTLERQSNSSTTTTKPSTQIARPSLPFTYVQTAPPQAAWTIH